jgi:endonuclease IV
MQIGISTAWNAMRHKSARKMVLELLDLGFDALELNVHVTEPMIREIEQMVAKGEVRICSLHNCCPLPKGMPREKAAINIPIASPNNSERRKAVDQTRQTIEWAARLGASAVVIHAGIIPGESRQREALRLMAAGFRDDAKKIVAEDLMERAAVRQTYIRSVTASLDELSRHAEQAASSWGWKPDITMGRSPRSRSSGSYSRAFRRRHLATGMIPATPIRWSSWVLLPTRTI